MKHLRNGFSDNREEHELLHEEIKNGDELLRIRIVKLERKK
jgi:uncharacterized protein (DUF2249 family)